MMDIEDVFLMFIGVTVVELLVIYVMVRAINTVLKSEFVWERFKKSEATDASDVKEIDKESKSSGFNHQILTLLLFMVTPALMFGADGVEAVHRRSFITVEILYFICIFDVILVWVIFYLRRILRLIIPIDKKIPLAAVVDATLVVNKKTTFVETLTGSVPIEDESTILMDHVYDGIRELDNNLPPWWKWGFYFSIVVAILYLLNYHVFKFGDLQIESYNKEMAQSKIDVQAYLESQSMNVDENSVTRMTDTKDINNGAATFSKYCKVCHGDAGQGTVGPNLTDKYWLYGGNVNGVFKTIKYGAQRGMKSWKDELNPIEMQEVASYILSLGGSNPPNPKAPEGDEFIVENL